MTPPEIDTSDLKALRRTLKAMQLFIQALMVIERVCGGIPGWLRKMIEALMPDIDTLEDAVFESLMPDTSGEEAQSVEADILAASDTLRSSSDDSGGNRTPDSVRNTDLNESGRRGASVSAEKSVLQSSTLDATVVHHSNSLPQRSDESRNPDGVKSGPGNFIAVIALMHFARSRHQSVPHTKITPRARPPPHQNPKNKRPDKLSLARPFVLEEMKLYSAATAISADKSV